MVSANGLLVLTRRVNESIVIEHAGERITVCIGEAHGQVKLLFDAPHSFRINRSEVQHRVDSERARAE
jgi:carbon storage regulator CsrA